MLIFIPFAFGGNPASESVPRAVYDYFTKKKIDGIKHSIIFEQTLYESAYQYMLRINKEISLILKNKKISNAHMIPYLFFAPKIIILFLRHSSYKNRHIIPGAVIAVSQHPFQYSPAEIFR